MENTLTDKPWVKKIIRIKKDYIKLCEYLDFLASKKGIDYRLFISQAFDFSMNYLVEQGFCYEIDYYKNRRHPKGFSITPATSDNFDNNLSFYSDMFYRKFKRKLFVSEFTELLLYIYAINNIKESELKEIDVSWGIEKV
jgi:hypothetical protein